MRTVKPYTQVRVKRTTWDTKGQIKALAGALMKVEGYSRGVYTLFIMAIGGRWGWHKVRFRVRRRDFAVLRQKIYCDMMEVELPDTPAYGPRYEPPTEKPYATEKR